MLDAMRREAFPLSLEGVCNILELEYSEVILLCERAGMRQDRDRRAAPSEWLFTMRELFQLMVANAMCFQNDDFARAFAAIRLLDAFEAEVQKRIPDFALPQALEKPELLHLAAPFERERRELRRSSELAFGPTLDLNVRENDRLMFIDSALFSPSEVFALFTFGPIRLSEPVDTREPPRMMPDSEFRRDYKYAGADNRRFTIHDLLKDTARLRKRTARYYR